MIAHHGKQQGEMLVSGVMTSSVLIHCKVKTDVPAAPTFRGKEKEPQSQQVAWLGSANEWKPAQWLPIASHPLSELQGLGHLRAPPVGSEDHCVQCFESLSFILQP